MDHRSTENFFAITSPGLEDVCATEISAMQISGSEVTSGGVTFQGRLRDLYLANLWLRTASRILVRFAEFRSRDFPDLHRKAQRLPWGRFIKQDTSVSFRITCHASRLNHTTRIAETLESSVNSALGRSTNPVGKDPQLVLVRIVDDQITLSIDSSGELLHRRGYRKSATTAPLRETLAAGSLMLLNWNGREPLTDPLCGSGSFPLEGALLANHKAPGLERNYAFMNWPGYREGLWNLLCDEAMRLEVKSEVSISGADENLDAITAAKGNCELASLEDRVFFEHRALSQQPVRDGQGLVICNPPYGKRLSLGEDASGYYTELGRQLLRVYPGWRIAMICPDSALVKATGIKFSKIAELDNGGLTVGLFATR